MMCLMESGCEAGSGSGSTYLALNDVALLSG